jgi:iron(III) transport system substrate-binding protein
VVPNLNRTIKEEMRALTGANLLGTTNVDTQDAMLTLVRKIYK